MVDSFASLIAFPAVKELNVVKVAIDDDKGMSNTIYMLWPDGRRMWLVAQKEDIMGSPKLEYRLPIAYSKAEDYEGLSTHHTPHVLTIIKVAVDENKNMASSIYMLWPDGVRMWLASTEDAIGFPYIWHNLPVKYSMFLHLSLLVSQGSPDVMTISKITDDEDKGIAHAIYMVWPDGIRVWLVAQVDNPGEPGFLMTEGGQFFTTESGDFIATETPSI